jgi:hypothetical protein
MTRILQVSNAKQGNILVHQDLHSLRSPIGVTCSSAREAA